MADNPARDEGACVQSREPGEGADLMMDAAVLHRLGEAPRCEPFPEPVAGEGEVVVEVRCASLKPVDRQLASGTHYASPKELPVVCGTDGIGHVGRGERVFFGGARAPFGAMAERTVVPRAFTFPVPEELDDDTAAALPNPGVSAWLALAHRGKLVKDDAVLILGATGVTGRLAVQIARLLGAGRVVAAGRDPEALRSLDALGANAAIRLDAPAEELEAALVREAGPSGFQVVIDYVWGRPAEVFFAAITRREFAAMRAETRFVQAGEGAGAAISLPAAVLRSTAVTITGTAGIPSREVLAEAMEQVLAHAAAGRLRIATQRVALAEIEAAWDRETKGRRVVVAVR